jgi:hypothetical protein
METASHFIRKDCLQTKYDMLKSPFSEVNILIKDRSTKEVEMRRVL